MTADPAIEADALSERRVKLVDFRVRENCKGARLTAWGGRRCGRAWYDETIGGLHLTYTNSQGTFSSPVLQKAVSRLVADSEALPDKYYFVYRGNANDGALKVQFLAPGEYTANAGFWRDGRLREMSLRPGGWNAKDMPFDQKKLANIYITVSGTGDLELFEIGAIYQPTMQPEKEDLAPVDIDAVALFPEPRIWRRDKGAVCLKNCRPPQVSGDGLSYAGDWFRSEVSRFYGDVWSAAGLPVVFALAHTRQGEELLTSLGLNEDFKNVVHDGFVISVSSRGIAVVGRETMGVMNGVRALMRLIQQSTGDVGEPCIGTMTVVDWPRLKNRMLHQMMSSYRHVNRYEPEQYADRLEQFPLDARFNLFSFELGEHYRYDSVPGSGTRPQSWCRDDFVYVVERLNAAGAKAVPFFQSPGHQALGIFSDPKIRPELREDGNRDVFCTRHPDTYPFLFGIFEEMMGVCCRNKACAPDVFYAGGDEVRWKRGVDPDKRCRFCRDLPYNRLYVDHLKQVHDWLANHNLQMLMCSDMIVDNHNGLDAFKCAEVREEIPADVAYLHWCGEDFDMMKDFAEQGHDNWKLLTGYQESPVGEEFVKGYGLAVYTYNWWLNQTRCAHQESYGLMAMYLTGELAWRRGIRYRGQGVDKAMKWGNFLMRNWSRKPLRGAARTFSTVDLSDLATERMPGEFDPGKTDLGHVPLRTACDETGNICGVPAPTNGTPAKIAVARKASSLLFVHAAHLPAEQRKDFIRPDVYLDWTDGPTIATVRVRYEDGSSESCEMKFGWNVGESQKDKSYLSRYLADARAIWQGRAGCLAYQHEWVNPHPDRSIAELELISGGTPVRYFLMAVTARDVAE